MANNFETFLDQLSRDLDKKPVVSKMNSKFKILISTILSARTKDEVTEKVSERLFKRVTSFEDLNNISQEELESLIYPVGFYKQKAKRLKELAKIIITKYGGEIPKSIDELTKLPGIGLKTATLYLSLAENDDEICVDTHVHRICNRFEFVDTKFPEETYYELKKKLPKRYWNRINDLLVVFGQTICKPKKPLCVLCKYKSICPYYEKLNKFESLLDKYSFRKVSKSNIPREKGTYILKIYLKENRNILIGKRKLFFEKGYYFYVGSAFGSNINLYNRINRHLSNSKKKHWHIDYFLEYANIESVYVSHLRCESDVAKELENIFKPIFNFGNSDDKSSKSHLFYLKP